MSHAAERLHTIDELPDIRDCYELVDGELIIMMSPAGPAHGYLVMQLGGILRAYVQTNQLGMVFGEQTGFILTRRPDTVRAPDISFVSEARVPPRGLGEGYFPGPPDLAVEILSPSNRLSAMQRKIDQYFDAGTRLVWVIDFRKRTVVVHAPRRQLKLLREADALDGEDVIPGLRYEIAQLFARVRRD